MIVNKEFFYKPTSTARVNGSCNLWCKMTRGAVVMLCSAVGGPIGGMVGGAIASMINFRQVVIDTDDLDPLESTLITEWFNKKFIPKFELMLKKANKAASPVGMQDFAYQLKLVNEVQNEIAVLSYFIYLQKDGLSDDALVIRNNATISYLEELNKAIMTVVESTSSLLIAYNNTVKSTPQLLFPFEGNYNFSATATNYRYFIKGKDVMPTGDAMYDAIIDQTGTPPVKDNTPVNSGNTPKGVDPIKTNPNETVATKEETKNTLIKYAPYGLGFFIAWLVFKKK